MAASRYRHYYERVVRGELMHKLQVSNVHRVPRVKQISVSIATKLNPTSMSNPVPAAFILELVTGQQATFTRIRRANAMYKVRAGMLEGAKVHLHGDNMYHFMDRLLTQARAAPPATRERPHALRAPPTADPARRCSRA